MKNQEVTVPNLTHQVPLIYDERYASFDKTIPLISMRLMIRLAFLVLLPVVTSGWASLFSSSSSAASSSAEVGVDGELSSMGDESAAATEAEAVAAAAAAAAAESAAAAAPPPPRDDGRLTVRFVNEAKIDLDLFWDDGSYGVIVASKVAPNGGEVSMDTTVGHKLYWTVHGRRQQVGGDQVMTAGRTTYVLPASTPVAMSASMKPTAWWLAMGCPMVLRSLA